MNDSAKPLYCPLTGKLNIFSACAIEGANGQYPLDINQKWIISATLRDSEYDRILVAIGQRLIKPHICRFLYSGDTCVLSNSGSSVPININININGSITLDIISRCEIVRYLDFAIETNRPVFLIVMINLLELNEKHCISIVIYPNGMTYMFDPNGRTLFATRKRSFTSDMIEDLLAPRLNNITSTSNDISTRLIPQSQWCQFDYLHINSSYEDIGIESGWCVTLTFIIAAMIVECKMSLGEVYEYLAKLSRHGTVLIIHDVLDRLIPYLITPAEFASRIKSAEAPMSQVQRYKRKYCRNVMCYDDRCKGLCQQ